MAIEIDFIPVGEGKKNGDAIAIRYGSPGAYKVLVYDGGTQDSGVALVDHIKEYYQTNFVDDVVNSHPDLDHSSGLSVVLEKLSVGKLWMHRPWNHSQLILDYFKDGRITNTSLKERLQNKMGAAYALENLALSKGIQIFEPFQGMQIGGFYVMSPEKNWYIHDLIRDFEKSPESRVVKTTQLNSATGILSYVTEAAKSAVEWMFERWDQELLRENIETSAENESSAILYYYDNEHNVGVLLTGDAGILALRKAGEYMSASGMNAPSLIKFIQIPHHGGRHNVSTSVLDMLLGPKLTAPPSDTTRSAFVSAGANSEYPRRMVSNAFIKRGCKVIATKGAAKSWRRGMPDRAGWIAAEAVPHFTDVEKW